MENAKMMAGRPSETRKKFNTKNVTRLPETGESQSNVQQSMTLFVRVPAQRTISVQIDGNQTKSAIEQLKQHICKKIGLLDSEAIVLSYGGRSLDCSRSLASQFLQNLPRDTKCQKLATIQVSVVLTGGSSREQDVSVSDNPQSQAADARGVLKEFMQLIKSLSLTKSETKRLAESLIAPQVKKMSNFVDKNLDEVQILELLSRLRNDQIREALTDLKSAIEASTDYMLLSESILLSDGQEKQKELKQMLELINKKIGADNIRINKSDPVEQQIGLALVAHRETCQIKLLSCLNEKQWDQVFVDVILQKDQVQVLFELLRNHQQIVEENQQSKMDEYLEQMVTKSVAWYTSLSEEDRAKVDSFNGEADFVAIWGKSDTSKDKLLQKTEFLKLLTIYDQERSDRGIPSQPMTEEQRQLWYNYFDARTPSIDGVSMEDFGKGFGVFIQAFKAKQSKTQTTRASKFWQNLRIDQKSVIWTYLTENLQREVLVQPNNIITEIQQVNLWDIIIQSEQAADIWCRLLDTEKVSSLEKMHTKIQIELWSQICKDDQSKFLDLLPAQEQKIQFWSHLSYQQQDKMLKLISQLSKTDLLGQLDQESLCITMSMHKDKLIDDENTLIDLLQDNDKRLAVETFIKYGRSSVTNCSSAQFIKNLDDQTYDGFNSLKNIKPELSQAQVIENPKIDHGLITLSDVQSQVKLHVNDFDSVQHEENEDDHQATDEKESSKMTYSTSKIQQSRYASDCDDLPRTLHPTLVGTEGDHYKEWKMEQANPDPILHESKKSFISSYEYIDDEIGYWCIESFTIANKMSQLYKGQDGHVYIFSRQSNTSQSDSKEVEAANDILLHVFSFVKSPFYFRGDMKLVKLLEQSVEEKFEKTIEASLLAEFTQEITDSYNDMKNKASNQQIERAIMLCSNDLRNHLFTENKYNKWIDAVKGHIEGQLSSSDTNEDRLLDEMEFQKFFVNNKGILKHFSGGHDDSRSSCDKHYDLFSRLTPEVDGISYEDCFVFFMQIWFPLWCTLLIKDNTEESSHQIYNIKQDSHLGKELLKKEQVKKTSEKRYMDQAPYIIQNKGKLWLVYTCATTEKGPCVYFYDLENNRTCAKVSKAEILIDCYPHQTDKILTNIRYIKDKEVFQRSVDFKQFQANKPSIEEIYDVAQDDSNLVKQGKFTRLGEKQDNWGNRYIGWGLKMEVTVNVSKYEGKNDFEKSFQLLFKGRENQKVDYWNWCVTFQSYEEDKAVIFKSTKIIEGAEFIVTKQASGAENDAETFAIAQNWKHKPSIKQIRLVYTTVPESDLRTKDTEHFHGIDDQEGKCIRLRFDEMNKFSFPLIFKEKTLVGLFVSEKKKLSKFQHGLEQKKAVKLQQLLQEKKLWMNFIVSYPFLFYTGLSPDCRQIVVANLADTSQPSKIIHLPESLQLQNLVRSNLDDRIYFQAFVANRGNRGTFELLLRFPFIKNENFDSHDLRIRRLQEEQCDPYAKEWTKIIQNDFVSDSDSPNNQLFVVARQEKNFSIADKPGSALKPDSKIILEIQRSSQNNFYWLEESPSLGSILRGVIQISTKYKKQESTFVNHYAMGDSISQSITVESKLVEEKLSEVVSVLDRDLNLHVFIVNEDEKSFQPLGEVRNLQSELKIDAQWLKFNKKPQIDFDTYKLDYRLFSSETVGVVLKDLDFIVYYNINSQTFSIVDTAHEKFPLNVGNNQDKMTVEWTKNVDGSDFRLMQCNMKKTAQSYFVVYPAPESRKLDLFGFQGRESNVSTNFISENLFLAQFQYKDVHQNLHDKGYLKQEENYWSVIDKTGQIKSLTLNLDKKSKVIFSKQTQSGSIMILNCKAKYKIVRFNLKGEVVFQSNFEDGEDILGKANQMIKNRLGRLVLKQSNRKKDSFQGQSIKQNDDIELRLSNIFLESSLGGLYRIASILKINEGQEPDSKQTQSFSLAGAIQIPIEGSCQDQKANQVDLTVLVFLCKSEAQYQQFQQAVFHVSLNSLFVFSPKFAKKSIRIISLKRANKSKHEKLSGESSYSGNYSFTEKANKIDILQSSRTQLIDTKDIKQGDTVRIAQNSQRIHPGIEFESNSENDLNQPDIEPFNQTYLLGTDLRIQDNLTWIDFKKKSPERVIEIEKIINLNPSQEFDLQLGSIEVTTKNLSFNVSDPNNKANQDQNYLSIFLPDKVFVYDLSFQKPIECFSCFKMNFFVNPQTFVDLGLPAIWTKQKNQEIETWRQVTACHQRNQFLAKKIIRLQEGCFKEKYVSLIQNYSISDVQGLNWLAERLEKNTEIQTTSFDQTMVSYQGHNFFSIFKNQKDQLQYILEFIHDQLGRLDVNKANKMKIKSVKHRIYKIISMPVHKFANSDAKLEIHSQSKIQGGKISKQKAKKDSDANESASHFTTALESCIDFDNVLRDLLISLAHGNILRDLATDQAKVQKIIENYSPALDDFLKSQVTSTPFTKKIKKITWPKNVAKYITFIQSSQQIDQEQVQIEVDKKFKKTKNIFEAPVEVKMLRTKWLLQNKQNFAQFSVVLQRTSSELIYDTDFMKVLIKGYWPKTSQIVIYWCFIPWLMYLICTIFLFENILGEDEVDDSDDHAKNNNLKYILSFLDLILIAYQFFIEIIQIKTLRWKDLKEHFGTIWNALDQFQLGSTLWIIIANLPEGGSSIKSIHRVVAVFAIFIIYAKLFDWLRLFEETAFYIKLVSQTLSDIKYFIILFFSGLAMFGSSMMMLQNNIAYGGEHFIRPITNIFIIDQLLNQYLLGLGDFLFEEFEYHPQWFLCWGFFLAATFFTQITMLNMLIAIMGNTFDMVIEKRAIYVMQSKLQTLSEYVDVVTLFLKDSQNFLFIVKQVADEDGGMDDNDSWEGGFTFLRKNIHKKLDLIKAEMSTNQSQQIQKVREQIRSANEKTREDNRESKAKIEKIEEAQAEMQSKLKLQIEGLKGQIEAGQTKLEAKIDLLLEKK